MDETSKKPRWFSDQWWDDRTILERVVWGLGFVVLVGGLAVAAGLVLMVLWNWLMPDLFGLKTIDLWQAAGLFVLARILFGGAGRGEGGRQDRRRRRHLQAQLKVEADREGSCG
jgi:hypothetical protein